VAAVRQRTVANKEFRVVTSVTHVPTYKPPTRITMDMKAPIHFIQRGAGFVAARATFNQVLSGNRQLAAGN
jgi:hypothetical protein